MIGDRLLARLQPESAVDVLATLATDIERVTNAVQGHSGIHPEFGLGDYDLWLGEELWTELAREIQAQLHFNLPELGKVAVALPFRDRRGEFIFAIDAVGELGKLKWFLVFYPRERRFRCRVASKLCGREESQLQ